MQILIPKFATNKITVFNQSDTQSISKDSNSDYCDAPH